MNEHRLSSDITDDGVERRETLRKDYVSGAPHGDEEAGARSPAASLAPWSARSSAGPSGPWSEARSARPRVPRLARLTRGTRTTRSSSRAKSGARSSPKLDRTFAPIHGLPARRTAWRAVTYRAPRP